MIKKVQIDRADCLASTILPLVVFFIVSLVLLWNPSPGTIFIVLLPVILVVLGIKGFFFALRATAREAARSKSLHNLDKKEVACQH